MSAPVAIPEGAEVIGVNGIADLLGVPMMTVATWRRRGQLLPERWLLAKRMPAWDLADVLRWAEETGRPVVGR